MSLPRDSGLREQRQWWNWRVSLSPFLSALAGMVEVGSERGFKRTGELCFLLEPFFGSLENFGPARYWRSGDLFHDTFIITYQRLHEIPCTVTALPGCLPLLVPLTVHLRGSFLLISCFASGQPVGYLLTTVSLHSPCHHSRGHWLKRSLISIISESFILLF